MRGIMKKRYLICYLIFVPLEAISSVLFALLLQPVIDAGAAGEMIKFMQYVWIFLAASLLNGLCYYGEERFAAKLKADFQIRLREAYFTGMFCKSTKEYQQNDTAYYLTKITADSELIREKYCGGAMQLYRTAWSFFVSVSAIFLVDASVAVLVLTFAAASAFLPGLFQKSAERAEEEYLKSNQRLMSGMQNMLHGYLIVKVFHIFEAVRKDFYRRCEDAGKKDVIRTKHTMRISVVSMMATQLSFIVTIAGCMFLVIGGRLSIGYVMAVTELLGGVMAPFQVFPVYIVAYKTGRKLYFEFKKEMDVMHTVPEAKALEELPEKLCLKNVSFSYENARMVLKDVSLELDLHKKYAVVGESGCGKSTLAKLLIGFLKPTEGTIEIDGVDMEILSEAERYRKLCYQGQQIALFDDSIENNILLGMYADDQKWDEVIRKARLREVLKRLPDGKKTKIGENGKNISGGEAQRIGLARCFAHTARFTVFDEITANLDQTAAREIESLILSDEFGGALVITHHLDPENKGKYDAVFEVKDGKILPAV